MLRSYGKQYYVGKNKRQKEWKLFKPALLPGKTCYWVTISSRLIALPSGGVCLSLLDIEKIQMTSLS